MDVTKVLEADHRQVEELFGRSTRRTATSARPMIDELVRRHSVHTCSSRNRCCTRGSPSVVGDEAVQEANNEHELARNGIDQMLALAPDEPGFGAALESVKAGIEHHVEEEEDEMFPKLRAKASVLDEIATPFMHDTLELGLPMPASAIAAASTKDELLAEAPSAADQRRVVDDQGPSSPKPSPLR